MIRQLRPVRERALLDHERSGSSKDSVNPAVWPYCGACLGRQDDRNFWAVVICVKIAVWGEASFYVWQILRRGPTSL